MNMERENKRVMINSGLILCYLCKYIVSNMLNCNFFQRNQVPYTPKETKLAIYPFHYSIFKIPNLTLFIYFLAWAPHYIFYIIIFLFLSYIHRLFPFFLLYYTPLQNCDSLRTFFFNSVIVESSIIIKILGWKSLCQRDVARSRRD